MFIYPWDILDEGIDPVLSYLAEDVGVDAIHLATTYHSVKMLLPHNPRRKMLCLDSSGAYFQPEEGFYATTPIKPVMSPWAKGSNPLADIATGCKRHGLGLVSWTLSLHDDLLPSRHPHAAQKNVFGDLVPYNLCPSSPEARAYVVGLAKDLSTNYDLSGVELESAYFGGLGHRYNHEKGPYLNLGPQGEFLFSLCFCENCLRRAKKVGIDIDQLQGAVRKRLEMALSKVDPAGSNPRGVEELLPEIEGLGEFVRMREQAVTSLIQEVKEGISTRLHFLLMGEKWTNGTDNAAIARVCDIFEITCYASSPEAVRTRVEGVAPDLRDLGQLAAILSISHSHAPSAEALEGLVEELAGLGLSKIIFYNYGLVPREGLGWVERAARLFREREFQV